jgi:two-component system chemotaxis response regulator CheY
MLQEDRSLQPRKILVVDDDEAMRALLQRHLTNAGYDVALAEDAVVAGRMILKSTPDLLIVDVDMPYLNGLEFVATLMADTSVPCVPIVFITAHEHFVQPAQAFDAPCLIKPFGASELLETVAQNIAEEVE